MHKIKAEGTCAALGERLFLSMQDGIALISTKGLVVRHAPFAGAGALCVGKDLLFCADQSGVIWRLDQQTLMPQALGCGGPDVCSMCLSEDAERLYALVCEADSVLMSDARTGAPLAVNRCGCHPRMLICRRDVLIAAGGESGCVHLYHSKTLESLGNISMPGPVYSVAVCGSDIYALCLTAELNTLFAARNGKHLSTIQLPGMPGCLLAAGDSIFAAVQGGLYAFSRSSGRIACLCDAPGRASKMLELSEGIVLYDPLSECVFAGARNGVWKRICSRAKDICLA